MSLIVHLSTTHEYSLGETVSAFVQLCSDYHLGCLQCLPGFFQPVQTVFDYGWVLAQYKLNNASLIEPYRLGEISTDEFLTRLMKIFNFPAILSEENCKADLAKAWSSSIKITEKTQGRLFHLVDQVAKGQVHLVANTNELDMQRLFDLFSGSDPRLLFKVGIDLSVKRDESPIEILPGVYLWLSYRMGSFRFDDLRGGIVEKILAQQKPNETFTFVGEYAEDLYNARKLGIEDVRNADEFYPAELSSLLSEDDNPNYSLLY